MVYIAYHERFCRFCDDDLAYEYDDPYDHYKESHFHCHLCDGQVFRTGNSLHQHYAASHDYCQSCQRVFNSQQQLDTHLRSRIHMPANIKCPMVGCQQMFISPAAVVLHLETGKCVSGVTRAIIDRYIVKYDRNNLITNPSRLITGPPGSRELQPMTTNIATKHAWNGNGFECYFCHKEFQYLAQLNQHLASPKHTKPTEMIYRCPNRDCGLKKATLSGLCQHIESGSCGVNRSSNVTDTMNHFVGGMRRLAL
ncbi:hypothetical protein CALCODRAFT_468549 [Calocera cornea HHB12733]|uniref:C2H2-type domain-containing protein n=1 Tax=Calocera cornea HHB12733 TaxID=1353952 RepID=A0A165GPU3_9BASI|nr:hypothetical protein CALCODRAFT_468549 [Calocera cornea HHB12733]